MKFHLLIINLLCISSVTMQTCPMQDSLKVTASDYIVRTLAFGASATVATIGLRTGYLSLRTSLKGALGCGEKDLVGHFFGSVISVPSMFIGSFGTYFALLAAGIKHRYAFATSGIIFGSSMLVNSLSHWINLTRSYDSEKELCAGTGVFTGLVGLAILGASLKR